MPLIRIELEYDGTDFVGWQAQPNGPSVQTALERALKDVTEEDIRVHGSGRTDAGVHAAGQVAHFETGSGIPPEKFAVALNTKLPGGISVLRSEQAPPEFHSRFSAKWKWYRYKIYNAPGRSPLRARYSNWIPGVLDRAAMAQAAPLFEGEHDFYSFCAEPDRQEDTRRTIFVSRLRQDGDMLIYDCVGSGFLYNMVRVLSGTLLAVGRGALTGVEIAGIERRRSRDLRCTTLPALGLCLMRVGYEPWTHETMLSTTGVNECLP